ncbi:hypothetical protein KQI68_04155 [Peptoniphilus sp. MSJ-1]|uniref:Uncharacterized protein n=1 Tax=Peptoniphilus ovalis TaxID=2841503 RepID=A0ABS6FIJ2_9FIRM|nr:hypothetical protein [Peptoniphilus ovalis]MBU5669030.1 hypothetical protein [Peptoniphilus ovalis]
MNSKNWQKIFFIFSITVLVVSIVFFIYSIANKKYSSKLEMENNRIKEEIQEIKDKSKKINEENNEIDVDLNLKSQEFYEKYGYQFESNKSDEIKNIVDNLKEENKNLSQNIKTEIKNYENFYLSNIYENENFDKSVDFFLNFEQNSNFEKVNNIYSELDIDNLIKNSDGFIKYILDENNEPLDLKILLFYASIYSYEIYNFQENNSVNISDVITNLNNLRFIYSEMERKNYNVGDLKPNKLENLIIFISEKAKKYYENQGIIKSLEKGA